MPRQSLAFLAAFGTALLSIACGSSGSTSSGTGGGTTTAGSGGTGGSSTTTTTGSGGAGGSATTTTTTTTTGTGGAGMGACTNAADVKIAMEKDLPSIVGMCGTMNLGAEPATLNCIKMGTGLSDACALCFDATVACAVMNCLGQCISDSGSPECKMCRAEFCDPPFEMCSGLTVPK